MIDGTTYIKVTYIFLFKLRWSNDLSDFEEETIGYVKILHKGYLYKKTPTAVPETFLDKQGHPTQVNLDTDGTLLPVGSDPTTYEFPDVPLADFSDLNLEF